MRSIEWPQASGLNEKLDGCASCYDRICKLKRTQEEFSLGWEERVNSLLEKLGLTVHWFLSEVIL